jgi:hypothetical protein
MYSAGTRDDRDLPGLNVEGPEGRWSRRLKGNGNEARIVMKGNVYRLFSNLLFCFLFTVTVTGNRDELRHHNPYPKTTFRQRINLQNLAHLTFPKRFCAYRSHEK